MRGLAGDQRRFRQSYARRWPVAIVLVLPSMENQTEPERECRFFRRRRERHALSAAVRQVLRGRLVATILNVCSRYHLRHRHQNIRGRIVDPRRSTAFYIELRWHTCITRIPPIGFPSGIKIDLQCSAQVAVRLCVFKNNADLLLPGVSDQSDVAACTETAALKSRGRTRN